MMGTIRKANNMYGLSWILFGIQVLVMNAVMAGETGAVARIRHRFLAVDESRKFLHFVDEYDRTQDWSVAGNFRDIQLIGDSRVALSDGLGVTIVDLKTKRMVSEIHPPQARGTQSFRWQLGDRFLIVAGGVLTTDAAGQVLNKTPLSLGERICRTTAEGGWVFGSGAQVKDISKDGKVLAQHTVPGLVRPSIYHVAKRADGGYYATSGYGRCAVSLDAGGKVLQRFEYPQAFFFGGLQVLANDNLVVANWAGHGGGDVRDEKKGPQVIEFTPDGKVVWIFRDPEKLGSIHHVIVLDGLDIALSHEEVGGKMIPVKNAGAPTTKPETKQIIRKETP